MKQVNKDQLIKRIKCASKLLDSCVKLQLAAVSEVPLDLRKLTAHLSELATMLETQSAAVVDGQHRLFSVIPHARWLGMQRKINRERASFVVAGRAGGKRRSVPKRITSIENGRSGGRPRGRLRNRQRTVADTILLWFRDPSADAHLSIELKQKFVRQVGLLPLYLQKYINGKLRDEKIDPARLGLPSDWCPKRKKRTPRSKGPMRSQRPDSPMGPPAD